MKEIKQQISQSKLLSGQEDKPELKDRAAGRMPRLTNSGRVRTGICKGAGSGLQLKNEGMKRAMISRLTATPCPDCDELQTSSVETGEEVVVGIVEVKADIHLRP